MKILDIIKNALKKPCNHVYVRYYKHDDRLEREFHKIQKEWKIACSNGELTEFDFRHIAGTSLPSAFVHDKYNRICRHCGKKKLDYDNYLISEIIRMREEIDANTKNWNINK